MILFFKAINPVSQVDFEFFTISENSNNPNSEIIRVCLAGDSFTHEFCNSLFGDDQLVRYQYSDGHATLFFLGRSRKHIGNVLTKLHPERIILDPEFCSTSGWLLSDKNAVRVTERHQNLTYVIKVYQKFKELHLNVTKMTQNIPKRH